MLRIIARLVAIAAMVALAVPNLAAAETTNQQHAKPPSGAAKPAVKPPPGPPAGGARPTYQPHPGPGPGQAGPHPGPGPGYAGPHPGPGGQVTWRGRSINRIHVSPYIYPSGWGYRRWAIGAALPPLFLAPAYFYTDWALLGLAPPDPGFQWVRYGPDLLLVNIATGQVVDVIYGAFY